MSNETGNHVHSFVKTEVPSTCIEKGYTLYRCECGAEHKENYKPLAPHKFVMTEQREPTCTEAGERKLKCSVCGEEKSEAIKPLGHAFGEWKTQEFATCTRAGKETRLCERCGYREERVIKAKGHKLTNPKKSKTQKGMVDYYCPNCGETVTLPSKMSRVKKPLRIIAIIVAITVLLTVAVLTLNDPVEYAIGNAFLKAGNDTHAYYCFRNCRAYKDSLSIIRRFTVEYEKETYIYYGFGEPSTTVYEREFDDQGNLIGYTESDDDYVWVYEYNELGKETLCIKKSTGGKVLEKTESSYDDKGNLILKADYNEDRERIVRKEAVYNDEGDLIASSTYDDEGRLEWKTTQKYDDSGRLISKYNYTYDTEYIDSRNCVEREYKYEYDKNGNLLREICLDPDGNEAVTNEYTYDKKGRLRSEIGYNDNGGIDYECTYNKYGNCTKYISYYENGEIARKTTRNKNGDFLSWIEYNEDGEVYSKSEYKYDRYGNRTYYVWGDKPELTDLFTGNEGYYEEKYKYDRYGNETSLIRSDDGDVTKNKTKYKYNFAGIVTSKTGYVQLETLGEWEKNREYIYEGKYYITYNAPEDN